MTEKVIIDGDWGGDEMQLSSVLLANPEKVQVLGATCVFGNTDHDQVMENARNILHFLNASNIKVYPGSKKPSDSSLLEGDGAHGGDGLGNVSLDRSPAPYEKKNSVDFILEQLRTNEAGTVSIIASGPLTNIAQAAQQDFETMKRAKQIIVMGGCTHDMPAHDIPVRRGNITHHAEFNFQQAAQDASDVLSCGLPVVLIPMNCSHQLTLTPQRQEMISQAYQTNPKAGNTLLKMMTAPENFDRIKFNSSPVMHDIHCSLYLLYPSGYETERGDVNVSPKDNIHGPTSQTGRTEFHPRNDSNVVVATSIKNPDHFFNIFLQSMTFCVPPQQPSGNAAEKSPALAINTHMPVAETVKKVHFGNQHEENFSRANIVAQDKFGNIAQK